MFKLTSPLSFSKIVRDSYDFLLHIKVIMLTAMEYLREDMEERNTNSCEVKETPDLEVMKNNQGTSTTEMPDMTTTISHMPEDTAGADVEVRPAWQAVQRKGNDGKLAKLKVFGEKTSKRVHICIRFWGITFCFREESYAQCRSFCWLGLCRCCCCLLL